MNEEQFTLIENAIHLIDREVKHIPDLDTLSEGIGLSKYHLHRLFRSITGKPLMAYVRGRKLTMSLSELAETDMSIMDIAFEYQFEYEQSYIRAFRQQFGLTPSRYRKLKNEVNIEEKIDVRHLRSAGQGIIVQPRMCIAPEFYIQGLRKEIVHTENYHHSTAAALAMELQNVYLKDIPNVKEDLTYIGLVLYSERPEYSNGYVAGIEVTEPKPPVSPLERFTIPRGEYAVFRYIGLHSPFETTFATLKTLYDFIDRWVLDTAYRQTQPFHFEKMNMRTCGETYCEMDIYTPVSVV